MKSGWYVGKSTNRLFVVADDETVICIGNKGEIHTLVRLLPDGLRPATKQDIIDLLLPTIEDAKEPGQVAYEARFGKDVLATVLWPAISPEYKLIWARVEQAVKDSLKEKE